MSNATWADDPGGPAGPADDVGSTLRKATLFYASFDSEVQGDYGAGDRSVWTRSDDPADAEKERQDRKRIVARGYDRERIGIAKDQGVHGGALELRDLVPGNSFLFFPGAGKVAYRKGGWGGTVSLWMKTDLDKRLKTPHVDPFMISQKAYNNGAVWCDFSAPPRDLRLGAFSLLPEGETPDEKQPESEQPIVRAKRPAIKPDQWHHLVVAWENFDTGMDNARVVMYLDGQPIARLGNLEVHMNWDLEQIRIFVGAAFIGWIDEFAVFDKSLSQTEVQHLIARPDSLAALANSR